MNKVLRRISAMPCTAAIIAVWVLVWLLVCIADVAPLLCGKGLGEIDCEYYRLFTAGLTHISLPHLLANSFALFWIGFLWERRMGSVRFLAAGVVCAVLAQLVFLAIFRNAGCSVGGSVYNFALCGFGLVMQFLASDFPKLTLGTWSGNCLAIYLAVTNIPYLIAPDITTLIIHGIALAFGALAALVWWIAGIK